VLPRIIAASSAIIVNSNSTAADVRRFYRVGDIPIHVVYPGYDAELFRPPDPKAIARAKSLYQLDNFVLSVGETRPYKNIRRLIEAFASVRIPELQLAIVGKSSKMDPGLVNLPNEHGVKHQVKFLGYVPDADLVALYGGARAFVFPSLYEGFGFPALEAMACGCPVVASTAASIPEVCGDDAQYVDPASVESIAQGIRRVVSDPALQSMLREQGLRRAASFSYEGAAERVLEILGGYTTP
jgi:glycosyltransferase involved in cell wall biosynthesis